MVLQRRLFFNSIFKCNIRDLVVSPHTWLSQALHNCCCCWAISGNVPLLLFFRPLSGQRGLLILPSLALPCAWHHLTVCVCGWMWTWLFKNSVSVNRARTKSICKWHKAWISLRCYRTEINVWHCPQHSRKTGALLSLPRATSVWSPSCFVCFLKSSNWVRLTSHFYDLVEWLWQRCCL